MGISNLLTVLRGIIDSRAHLRHCRGQTAAIDAYSWLHKGCYAAATELCTGSDTDKVVRYCLRRIELLQRYGVIPYVVFDGNYLPMKAGTETNRAKERDKALNQGRRLLAKGDSSGAHSFFVKAVDVTPAMAREFIVELEARDISFVVAPCVCGGWSERNTRSLELAALPRKRPLG